MLADVQVNNNQRSPKHQKAAALWRGHVQSDEDDVDETELAQDSLSPLTQDTSPLEKKTSGHRTKDKCVNRPQSKNKVRVMGRLS